MIARTVGVVALLCLFWGNQAEAASRVVLFMARADRIEYVRESDRWNLDFVDAKGKVVESAPIGGEWRVDLTVLNVYAGAIPARRVSMTMPMLNSPATPVDLFILADVKGNGVLTTLDWNMAREGFCLRREILAANGVDPALVDRLKQRHPCH